MVLGNGLSALLVSCESAVQNSAALSVKCGIFADPVNMQGLAHLLEHILFLGSQKYPGDNQFREFVHEHGGELDHSIFSMQVDLHYFEEALSMFANMFISPRMDFGLFENELLIIDSEFELRKYRDSIRFEQLLSHTSSKTHPFHRFTWGNNQSFSACDNETLYLGVKKLFGDNFIASNMKLVLIGQNSLEDLEELVENYFSNLKEGLKEDQIEKGVDVPIHLAKGS